MSPSCDERLPQDEAITSFAIVDAKSGAHFGRFRSLAAAESWARVVYGAHVNAYSGDESPRDGWYVVPIYSIDALE
jgi:hypothetical protein